MDQISGTGTGGRPVNARATDTPPVGAAGSVLDLTEVVNELRAARESWRSEHQRNREFGGREFPSRTTLQRVVDDLAGALFPMRLGPPDLRQESEDYYVGHTLGVALHALHAQIRLELRRAARSADGVSVDERALAMVRTFAGRLPSLRRRLDTDVQAAYHGDPAAHSVDEVLLCYPGIIAIIHHRLAHELYRLGAPLVARIISELAHSATGIDIHPGATIGESFFIDHGTGVVIGETAIIGQHVRVYQAVTLGAKRFATDKDGYLRKGDPRHPIVEDDVVIYAGATILGRITIGRASIIGGNVWLTHSVAPGSHVTLASSQYDTTENRPG
ncbi:MAG: serine acetyltransferase [Proteobacteria bacterium]|nr:MAG: serine acetyltransferase [Pseudomonadota bacterium]